MDGSSIDQSRFLKYQLVIRNKNIKNLSNSELERLTVDERRTDLFLSGYRQIKVNEVLRSIGEDERFQKIILALLCTFNFFYSFIAFMIPYVFFEPTYFCNVEHGSPQTCSMEQACSNSLGFSVKSAIRSLIVENKLYCDRRRYLYISEGTFVICGGLVSLILSSASDKIGRRPIFLTAYILTVVGTFICLISENLVFIVAGNMLSWSGMDTFFSMIFIYCNEVIGSALRSKSNALLFFFWGLGEIVFNGINIWIDDFSIIFLLQFLGLTISGVGLCFIKETPYWLYKNKKISDLFFVLRYIGVTNGRKPKEVDSLLTTELNIDQIMIKRIEESDSIELIPIDAQRFSPIKRCFRYCGKICGDPGVLFKLIGVTIITANIYIGYSLSILIPQKIGLASINVNGMFLGLSETVGYLIVIPFGNLIPRRVLNFVCCALVIILCCFLIAFDFTAKDWNEQVLRWSQTIASSLIKLVLCVNYALIFNYCSELFPTKMRGMTLGICVFVGRVMVIFSFFLQKLTDSFQIHPMIGTIVGALIAIPITLCLPETINRGISN